MSAQKLFVLFISVVLGTLTIGALDNAVTQTHDEVRVNGESW